MYLMSCFSFVAKPCAWVFFLVCRAHDDDNHFNQCPVEHLMLEENCFIAIAEVIYAVETSEDPTSNLRHFNQKSINSINESFLPNFWEQP